MEPASPRLRPTELSKIKLEPVRESPKNWVFYVKLDAIGLLGGPTDECIACNVALLRGYFRTNPGMNRSGRPHVSTCSM